MKPLELSIVIPAYNEEQNLPPTVADLQQALRAEHVPYEMIIVNDNSRDGTAAVIAELMRQDSRIRTVNRTAPGGFGRAIRAGLDAVTGDVVVICMADSSDHPVDVIAYYRKICEGYDCVFGSRFVKGSKVVEYPRVKLIVNRIVNKCMQWMFRCPFNDLTNAFKAYRTHVIRESGPFRSCHFNITIELALSALVRQYNIAQIPISWTGRTWGSSNLRLREMGRRYLATLLRVYAEKLLISDDLLADRLALHAGHDDRLTRVEAQCLALAERVEQLERPERGAESIAARRAA
ncbi:MAG: glycosyltransferase family 2 protein [Planctomycetes bacterium]|nr:glycosyltransferase family 2 protein [Planctomycetota bacterium]